MIRALRARFKEDRVVGRVAFAYIIIQLVAIGWDMPGAWGWENDGIAPRDFLAGVANNLSWGKGHRYPLLHNLIVAIPCLPALVIAVFTAESSGFEGVRAALLTPALMTTSAIIIRAVTVLFSAVTVVFIARITRRLFGTSAGRWAAAMMIINVSCAYYGRTSNLDGPYMMWIVLAVDRLLTIGEHEQRRDYTYFALFAAAAVATKDQAYAAFVLLGPIYMLLVPWSKAAAFETARAVGVGAIGYGVFSGALFNPTGFLFRVRQLSGPNAQDWRVYPSTWKGVATNATDLFFAQAEFWWSWPLVAVAWGGVLYVAFRSLPRGDDARFAPAENGLGWSLDARFRVWRLAPLVAGLSSLVAFTLVVGRTEHRFALPLGLWLSVYGGVMLSRLSSLGRANAIPVILVALGAVQPLALIATQLTDPRWTITHWLDDRPPGTVVEVYGKLVYLPQLDVSDDAPYEVQRVDRSRPRRRDPIIGAKELRGSGAHPESRGADVLIVPEPWARRFRPLPTGEGETQSKIRSRARADAEASDFFVRALDDRLPGYRVERIAKHDWPPFLEALGIRPVSIHGSTAERIWVLTAVPR